MVRNCKRRQGNGLYDPGRSNTAESTGRNYKIVYGTGDSSGPYYKDIFAVISENYSAFNSINLVRKSDRKTVKVKKSDSFWCWTTNVVW